MLFLFHIRARKLHASCTNTYMGSTKPSRGGGGGGKIKKIEGGGGGRKIEKLGGVCGELVEILAAVRTQMTAAKLTD